MSLTRRENAPGVKTLASAIRNRVRSIARRTGRAAHGNAALARPMPHAFGDIRLIPREGTVFAVVEDAAEQLLMAVDGTYTSRVAGVRNVSWNRGASGRVPTFCRARRSPQAPLELDDHQRQRERVNVLLGEQQLDTLGHLRRPKGSSVTCSSFLSRRCDHAVSGQRAAIGHDAPDPRNRRHYWPFMPPNGFVGCTLLASMLAQPAQSAIAMTNIRLHDLSSLIFMWLSPPSRCNTFPCRSADAVGGVLTVIDLHAVRFVRQPRKIAVQSHSARGIGMSSSTSTECFLPLTVIACDIWLSLLPRRRRHAINQRH